MKKTAYLQTVCLISLSAVGLLTAPVFTTNLLVDTQETQYLAQAEGGMTVQPASAGQPAGISVDSSGSSSDSGSCAGLSGTQYSQCVQQERFQRATHDQRLRQQMTQSVINNWQQP